MEKIIIYRANSVPPSGVGGCQKFETPELDELLEKGWNVRESTVTPSSGTASVAIIVFHLYKNTL